MFPPCQLSAKLHSDYMKKRDHTPWHPHSNLNVFYSFSAFLILLQGLSKVLFHYSTLPFLDDPWNAFDKCRVLQRFFLEIRVLVSFCSMNNFIQRKSAQPNIHHEAFKGHIHSGGGDALPWCHHCVLVACLCMLPHMKHLELSSTEELLRALSGLWIIQTRTARYVSEKHSGGQGGDSCTHTKHKHTLQQLYIDRVFKCVRKGRTDGLQACRDLDQAWGIPNKHAKRMLSYQKLASASH